MQFLKLKRGVHFHFLAFIGLCLFITSFYIIEPINRSYIQVQSADTLSFSKHIFPIIEQKCASQPCHGGEQYPTLLEYKTIRKQIGKIRFRLKYKKKPMPPLDAEEVLSDEEKDKIMTWIGRGAKQN